LNKDLLYKNCSNRASHFIILPVHSNEENAGKFLTQKLKIAF
jgi:hypothetical protein